MLGLSLSLPLPVFDHGQADLIEANARQKAAREERDRLVLAGEARVASLRAALDAHLARQVLLEKEGIPRAESVVQSLTRAASARLISLTDVIQARRALNELVMDETESLGDAFATYLDLLAEAAAESSPAAAGRAGAPPAESETTR
jgi:cobalt-zinc-cadmium efflux system outer membrane protein